MSGDSARFEEFNVVTAIVPGIVLPTLETMRRGIGYKVTVRGNDRSA